MNVRRTKILIVTLIILCTALSFAPADTKTIKGKMQNLNMKDESFKLMTEDGKSIELKAPSILMEDLKPGDEVLVTIDEGEVIAISLDKKEAD
jgi:translation elongation factor P/translation initiation factor 5A